MTNVIYPTILAALDAINVTLTVEKKEAYSVVHVSAPLYKNKQYTLTMVWSHAYTEHEILKEAASRIAHKYGIKRAEGFVLH